MKSVIGSNLRYFTPFLLNFMLLPGNSLILRARIGEPAVIHLNKTIFIFPNQITAGTTYLLIFKFHMIPLVNPAFMAF